MNVFLSMPGLLRRCHGHIDAIHALRLRVAQQRSKHVR
jgi:hypothetical protein